MSQTYFHVVALFAAGLVAGALNVIAGGGSMLTLPLMIFLGLPATVANGTNRVAILIQNIGASWSFHRRGLTPGGWVRLAVPPAVLGAVVGSILALRIGDVAFQKILAVVMVTAAAYTVWRPVGAGGGESPPPRGVRGWAYAGIFFLVGVYGGFLQAGIGFLLLAVTAAGGLDLVRGNAMKVALVLAFTPVSLAIFSMGGKVDWVMGFSLAAGNLLGGLAGVRLQVLKGHAWVRNVVTVTIVLFATRLLFGR